MAKHQSPYAAGARQMPVAQGAEVLSVKLTVDVPANLAVNDLLQFGELPADHVPVDYALVNDDLDTNGAPALLVDLGLENAAGDAISVAAEDGGDEWLDGSNLLQGAAFTRNLSRVIHDVQPVSDRGRMVSAKVMTAAATPAAGKVSLILSYRAAHFGG